MSPILPPPYLISTPFERLLWLRSDLDLFFGDDRAGAAAFLFRVWADLHGAEGASIEEDLRQQNRDVRAAHKTPRGRRRSERIDRAAALLAGGARWQAGRKYVGAKTWKKLSPPQRQKKLRQLVQAIRRRK
jgi:hypothetical protein